MNAPNVRGALIVTALLGSAAGVAVPSAVTASAAPASACPVGRAAVTGLRYVIFDGSSSIDTTTLHGNVHLGDQVNVIFNVPALPAGCQQVQLSLASYSSTKAIRHTRDQQLYQSQTGDFVTGGSYEMQVDIAPPPPNGGTLHFQLDFATGPVLTPPHYGAQLIASTRH